MTTETEPNTLTRVTRQLEALALAIMAGGMLALGAFVAPAVFHTLPLAQAGPLMTGLFRQFDVVLLVGLVIVVLCEVVRVLRAGVGSVLSVRVRLGLVCVLVLLNTWSLGVLHPKIEAWQVAGVQRGVGPEGKAFDGDHKQSEAVYKAQFWVASGVLLLLL